MCSEEHQQESLKLLREIAKCLNDERARIPDQQTIQISSAREWSVYYRRKHIYLWSATGISLDVADYGTFTLQAARWTLFDMPFNLAVTAPAYTTPTTLFVKWTDELLPDSYQYIAQAGYVALVSPQASTNAGSETVYTFAQEVNSINLQNNSGAALNYAFDSTVTAGSLVLADGQELIYSKKITEVHLLTPGAETVNGSAAGGIVLLGEL